MNNGFDYTMSNMKALGIICVVAGHSYTGSIIEGVVGLFHMPLFFFISGYLFNESKYIGAPTLFIKRKLSSLYCPTLKWVIFAIIIHNILLSLGIYNSNYSYAGTVPSFYNGHDYFINILNAFVLRCNELLFAGIWFLRYLLVASILCFVFIKYLRQKRNALMGLIGLLIISLFTSTSFLRDKFGGTPNLMFFSSFFYYFGFIWKKFYSDSYNKIATSLSACIMYVVSLFCGFFFWRTGMIDISASMIVPFTITALMGIFLIMSISKWLLKSNLCFLKQSINYVGGHTYDILMMHIVGFKVVTLIIVLVYGEDFIELANYPTFHSYSEKGWFVIYILFGINIPLVLKYLYYRLKSKIIAYNK